jgi:hypothetical protein
VTLIRTPNGWKISDPEPFNGLLSAGLRMVIRDESIPKGPGDVTCEVKEWYYRVNSSDRPYLELIVQEVKPGLLARFVSEQNQFFGGILTALFVCAPVVLIAWTFHVEPNHNYLWAFAGRHIRAFGFSLVFVVFLIIQWRLGRYRGASVFSLTFFFGIFFWTLAALALIWSHVAAYPHPLPLTNTEYEAYAQALAANIRSNVWPVLLFAFPWIALALKAVGLEFVAKVIEPLAKWKKGGA